MKKIKKRGAIYGVIALLLCVAVYLNWSYVDTPDELLAADQTNPDSTETSGTAEDKDYFAASRLSREQARDEAVSTLKELSESFCDQPVPLHHLLCSGKRYEIWTSLH